MNTEYTKRRREQPERTIASSKDYCPNCYHPESWRGLPWAHHMHSGAAAFPVCFLL